MVQCQTSSLPSEETVLIPSIIKEDKDLKNGIFIACSIICIWVISLSLLISLDGAKMNAVLLGIAILWQTFLYTGLFITAHDAMHGVVYPKNMQINNFIGKISLLLYGLLSYKDLLKKHWLHHRYPGSDLDPDYHNVYPQNLFLWYFHFMKSYWQWTQFFGVILIFQVLINFFKMSAYNLTCFWIIPSILSSLQLFYFGTFLPHRRLEDGYHNRHCARSIGFSVFWSFITCYHFGYHEEHHEYPHLPWWKLPEAYNMKTDLM